MFSARRLKLFGAIFFLGMAAFLLSELTEVPNVIDTALTVLLSLCVAADLGLVVVVATTDRLY